MVAHQGVNVFLIMSLVLGCAEELPGDGSEAEVIFGELDPADAAEEEDVVSNLDADDPDDDAAKSTSKTYYVSNPTSDCSSALRLTASGTKVTSIKPKSSTGATFDTLTSSGTSSLSDTWYCDTVGVCDKDRASATGCGLLGTVTVTVAASTSVSGLKYWFTDCTCPADVYD